MPLPIVGSDVTAALPFFASYTNTLYPNEINLCFGTSTYLSPPCYGPAGFDNGYLNYIGTAGPVAQGIIGSLDFKVMSDTGVVIEMQAATQSYGGVATAGIDPFISIDPSFQDASAFSIALSAGVGNGDPPSPVPLPATFPTLGVGLLGLALTRKMRPSGNLRTALV
jgi:hypothetical protein